MQPIMSKCLAYRTPQRARRGGEMVICLEWSRHRYIVLIDVVLLSVKKRRNVIKRLPHRHSVTSSDRKDHFLPNPNIPVHVRIRFSVSLADIQFGHGKSLGCLLNTMEADRHENVGQNDPKYRGKTLDHSSELPCTKWGRGSGAHWCKV